MKPDVLSDIPLADAVTERRRAEAWADTAAQHCRNEEYWRDRALKAEGTSPEEQDLIGCVDYKPRYAIWDSRPGGIVGNTPLFWMPNGCGYGSVVSEIGRYTEEETADMRDTDIPIPIEIVIKCAQPRVDMQLLRKVCDDSALSLTRKKT